MAVRIEDCPNCNHRASRHRPLDPSLDAHCHGDDDGPSCACPLDRGAVAVAMALAAALVKYG